MKAQKVTLTVKVEALHIDSTPALLAEVANRIRGEFPHGQLTSEDGDTVTWSTETENVEF